MDHLQKIAGWAQHVCGFLLVTGILAGCGTFDSTGSKREAVAEPPKPNLLRIDDEVAILFSGIPNPPDRFQGRIKEDGTINLALIQSVKAEGLTPGQLEQKIHDLYVDKYYRMLTVTVHAENRFFFVTGQVRNNNRFVFAGEMTVSKAIAAANGFTEFANRKKVKLTRSSGQTLIVNCDKGRTKPELDLPVYPGDHIDVPRRFF